MNNSIIQAQCVTLSELNHLFIDLEYEKSSTQNIGVYRSRRFNQKNKKYLQLDEIKTALKEADRSALKYIYLLGNNAMLHPEFNHILRMCLNVHSVTIYTDGGCINDKKARFLKRVEEEGSNELIFKVFINHYDEKTNDEISGRGSFRKAIHGICSLNKYGFNPILVIQSNIAQQEELREGFCELGKKFGFETEDINLLFLPTLTAETSEITKDTTTEPPEYDCMSSRFLTKSGVYSCPLLANDYRGRTGANLNDFSTKCYLETEKCNICKNCGTKLYANNWN